MRCHCVACSDMYNRKFVRLVEAGWPRWLAYFLAAPAAKNLEAAREAVAEYARLRAEGRIGIGFLGAVVCPDRETASRITETFGLRRGNSS